MLIPLHLGLYISLEQPCREQKSAALYPSTDTCRMPAHRLSTPEIKKNTKNIAIFGNTGKQRL
jgi:hypothetical protein|tara:strand:- start:103 stop:291 length:189 start_codon:yes stop_codon:yes gene_type:complete